MPEELWDTGMAFLHNIPYNLAHTPIVNTTKSYKTAFSRLLPPLLTSLNKEKG